jgi:hypothetical protein
MRQQRLPHRCQPHTVPIAVEQRSAQLSFQHPDLLTQRRLGDEEPLGRVGEVQVFGDRDEVPQIPPVDVHNHQLSHQVLDAPPRCQAE